LLRVGAICIDPQPPQHRMLSGATPCGARRLPISVSRLLAGSAARALVVERYDWARIAHRLDEALTEVVDSRPVLSRRTLRSLA